MRIVSAKVRSHILHLKYPIPLLPDGGKVRLREVLEILLYDENKLCGRGEAAPLEGYGVETLSQSLRTLENESKFMASRTLKDVYPSRKGFMKRNDDWNSWLGGLQNRPCARFAMETALLDLFARRIEMPLAKMLHPEAVDCISVGVLLGREDGADLAKEAEARVKEGFCCLKIKLSSDLGKAEKQLSCLRSAIGSSASIRADIKGKWAENEVIKNIEKLAKFGLELIEQPSSAQEWLKHPEWREQSPVPLAWDDGSLSSMEMNNMLEEGMIDVLVIKPHFIGSILESLSLAEKATQCGVSVIVTTVLESVIGRMATLQMACAVEVTRRQAKLPAYAHGLGSGVLMREDIINDPCPAKDGKMYIPKQAGLGLDTTK